MTVTTTQFRFPLFLDGATGTRLQSYGYTGGESAEGWVLAHPEAIVKIQKSYIEAGSNVIYAPTFGANRIKLAEYGLGGKVREYCRDLVALSRKAAEGTDVLVAGDITSLGKFLIPVGDATFDELLDVYQEQAQALEDAGVDLFVLETMSSLAETRAALLAVRKVSSKPVFVTFTVDENGRTYTGCDIEAALITLQSMGVDAFGMNCSGGPDKMEGSVCRLAQSTRIPLIVKPNAGLPKTVDGRTVYDCEPEEFAATMRKLAEKGASVFGGCCGTTAGHIQALTEALGRTALPSAQRETDDVLRLAVESRPFCLRPAAIRFSEVLECTEELEDDFEDADEAEFDVVRVAVTSEEDVQRLTEALLYLHKPLCLCTDDAAVLEKALQSFQGRAMVESTIANATLDDLAGRYGLVRRP